MDENITIPGHLKPVIDKVYDDLSSVLTDYESDIISADDLYAHMVNLQKQISLIIYTD